MAFRNNNRSEGGDRGRSFGGDRGSRGPRRDSDSRGGGRSFGGRSRDGGDRGRSFGGNRGGGRSFGGDRGRLEMHDATCDKCQSECQVPFKPSGDRPVLCSNCFEAQGNSHGGAPERRDRPSRTSEVSLAQFNELSKKVDKILSILENLEEEEEFEGEEDIEEEKTE